MKDKTFTYTVKKEDVLPERGQTIYDAVDLIMELDKNSPDFKKKMRGIVKRLVHFQKLGLLERFAMYVKAEGQKTKFLQDFIKDKIETHKEWSQKNDDEVWTSGD